MLCTPARYSSHVEQVMGNRSASQEHGLNLTYLQRKTYGMPHWIRMIWPITALWGCMMLRVESWSDKRKAKAYFQNKSCTHALPVENIPDTFQCPPPPQAKPRRIVIEIHNASKFIWAPKKFTLSHLKEKLCINKDVACNRWAAGELTPDKILQRCSEVIFSISFCSIGRIVCFQTSLKNQLNK